MSWKMVLLVFPSSFGSHWADVNHFGAVFQFWDLFQFCSNVIGGHVEFSFSKTERKKKCKQSLSFNCQEALPHRIHLSRYLVGNPWKNTAPSFYWEIRQTCNWQILSLSRPWPHGLLLFPLAVPLSSSPRDLGCLGWCILHWAFRAGHDPQKGPWVILRFKQMINKGQISGFKLHFILTIQILLPQKELVYIHLVKNEGWIQVSWV